MKNGKWCHTAILVFMAAIALAAINPAGGKGPRIAVLSNTLDPENHILKGSLSSLASSLSSEGYSVYNLWLDGLSDEALEGVDVFVLALPAFPLDQNDREILGRYLDAGGGLLIIVYPYALYLDSIEEFLKPYGISFGEWACDGLDAKVNQKSALASPRKCDLIGGAAVKVYCLTEPGLATAVASSQAGVLAAIAMGGNIGNGRLMFLGSDMPLTDQRIGEHDNLPFLLNSFDYLCGAGACDLAVLSVTFRGNNISPGDELKVIARLKNLGPLASSETKISFMLCKELQVGSPPKAVTKFKPAALEEIESGKKWKFKGNLRIPASVEPGEYYVVAVADPKGKTNDPFRANNTKASKKKLVIE